MRQATWPDAVSQRGATTGSSVFAALPRPQFGFATRLSFAGAAAAATAWNRPRWGVQGRGWDPAWGAWAPQQHAFLRTFLHCAPPAAHVAVGLAGPVTRTPVALQRMPMAPPAPAMALTSAAALSSESETVAGTHLQQPRTSVVACSPAPALVPHFRIVSGEEAYSQAPRGDEAGTPPDPAYPSSNPAGKTRLKGVSRSGSRFRAKIYFKHRSVNIGHFDTALKAALAYDAAARLLPGRRRGELNFSDEELRRLIPPHLLRIVETVSQDAIRNAEREEKAKAKAKGKGKLVAEQGKANKRGSKSGVSHTPPPRSSAAPAPRDATGSVRWSSHSSSRRRSSGSGRKRSRNFSPSPPVQRHTKAARRS